MRENVGRHKPDIDIPTSKDLDIYYKGIHHGQNGYVFDPHTSWTSQEKDVYRAGFSKARTMRRLK